MPDPEVLELFSEVMGKDSPPEDRDEKEKDQGPDDLIIGHDPEKVASKFLLLVNRTQPFGFGFTVFCVDAFDPLYIERGEEDRAVLAYQARDSAGELVTQFPATFQYLLINRSAYKPLYVTPKEQPVEKVKTGNYL